MDHLLLVSLGPIQDFIAAARKCQDLWFGSWMLSDLAREVARGISVAAGGGDALIFPGRLEEVEGKRPSVANKILVRVSGSYDVGEVSQAGRDLLDKRLDMLARRAFKRLEGARYFQKDVALLQLRSLMEYIWVSVPIQDDDYGQARDDAEKLLARRKATKTWSAVEWTALSGTGVPKSSLDGARESVLHTDLHKRLRELEREGRSSEASKLRRRYHIKGREHLCGVALLKRLGVAPEFWDDFGGRVRPAFHSTSHMAAAPILTRIHLRGEQGRAAVQDILDTLTACGANTARLEVHPGSLPRAGITDLVGEAPFERLSTGVEVVDRVFLQVGDKEGYDGSIFFEMRAQEILEECLREQLELEPGRGEVELLQRSIRKSLRALGLSEPTPYYAFLLADGDRMGAAIDALKEIGRHKKVFDELEGFAGSCNEMVASQGGSLIYSGGDDVLALLPLHTALQCAYRLKCAFDKAMERAFEDADELGIDVPTLSVGLGIAHHLDLMDEARALAKRAESLAKDSGRNALALVASKRSGPTLQVVGRWDEPWPLHQRLAHWARRLHQQDLPDRVAFLLAESVRVWGVPTSDQAPAPEATNNAVRALLQRVLERRRRGDGGDAVSPFDRRAFEWQLIGADPLQAAHHLSAEIQIARLLLSARNDAFEVDDDLPVVQEVLP